MGCDHSNVNEEVPAYKIDENIKIYSPENQKSFESKDSGEMEDQVNKNFKKQIISLNTNKNALEKKKEDYNLSNSPNLPVDPSVPKNDKLKKKLRCSQSVDKNVCVKKLDINLEKKEEDEDDSSYRGLNDSSYYAEETPKNKIAPKNNKKDNKIISSMNSSELSSDSIEHKEEINNNIENKDKEENK